MPAEKNVIKTKLFAKMEQEPCKLLPRKDWDLTGHLLIFHGRRICFAAKPNCPGCGVNDLCPRAMRAENIGRKPGRAARAARPAKPSRPAQRPRTKKK